MDLAHAKHVGSHAHLQSRLQQPQLHVGHGGCKVYTLFVLVHWRGGLEVVGWDPVVKAEVR